MPSWRGGRRAWTCVWCSSRIPIRPTARTTRRSRSSPPRARSWRGRRRGSRSRAARRLVGGGVTVRLVDAPAVHAKAVLADGWLYVGSANLTTASLDANREVGLALTDAGARAAVGRAASADLAGGRAP